MPVKTHDSQPEPTANEREPTHTALIRHIEGRAALGLKRYGTYLQPFNGRKALIDLLEELLDAAQYVMQEILEREELMKHIHVPLTKEDTEWFKTIYTMHGGEGG